ncbi:MAG: ATP-binding cassette domain-containing protein [Labilibaculum sp.]|jgi:phospholipid/cholesterol/gamma-HCH transport system ATP-binding protein|nr:ATP-binding cassette domain-containing protein [Labilibaculum sp.]MBI9057835.1 ATP-binding cassette domain-containing protein [Labilibaculum sp.]
MISLSNINKSFGNLQVLHDISITFEAGKTNLIIGQSGSGKTVLLKSIIGLHEVDSGSIFYNDRDFSSMNLKKRKDIRKEMGMVFQGGALFDSMTVEQNVLFPLNMFSDMNESQKMERVNFCLNRVNIKDANHLFPAEISGGMQKRVAIARAIALNPKYLFCDEPNSGLDPVTAILIDNLIQEITKEFNMTTIINTHDMNSVMEIGEKIVFINKGHKGWEGTKDEIFNTDNDSLNDFVFASELFKKIKKTS